MVSSRRTSPRRVPVSRKFARKLFLEPLEDRLAPAGDLLVSVYGPYPLNSFREYTPTGTLVRSVNVPQPPGAGGWDEARDLAVGPTGKVSVYNGTFTPYLATYDSTSGAWSQTTYAGWSTVNNVSYGGLAQLGNYVFATDMYTANGPSYGVVRFDTSNGTATRFGDANFSDLNLGLDGKLYALAGSTVYAYDPNSLALLGTVALPSADYRGIAVQANGDLYAVDWTKVVYHYNAAGTLLGSVNLSSVAGAPSTLGNTLDIDVAADGTVAVGTWSGHVALMDGNLANVTFFDTGTSSTTFVSFATPQYPLPAPALSVSDASVVEGNSGTTALTFTASLSQPIWQTVTANYATADGTATAGSDYQAASGTLTFAPGQTSQTVTVLVNGDTTAEPDETLSLNLSAPSNATFARPTGTGTIVNDDFPPTLSVADIVGTEGNSGQKSFAFTVTLSQALATSVTVKYATANGTASSSSDYTATSGTLTFSPGQTAKTVTVQVKGDTLYEADETFTLNLSNASGAVIGRPQGTATILNDDAAPTLSVSDATVTEGNSGTVSAVFTLTLSAATGVNATVAYATADGTATAGSDYQAVSGTATIAAGQTKTTVSVPVYGDTVPEANETFTLNLSSPAYATLARTTAAGTITDDDPISFVVGDASVTESNSGTSLLTYTVSLTKPLSSTATVSYATADGTATAGSDYAAASGALTFSAGQTAKTVTVAVYGDTTVEPDETVLLNLSGASGAPIYRGQGVGTIRNDDVPSLSVADMAVAEGNSGSGTASFTVTLSQPSPSPVTVSYATANGTATAGSDYAAASGSLTFAAGQTTATVPVTLYGDTTYEPDETFSLTLSSPTNATIARPTATGTILNDDAGLSVADASVTEGDTGSAPANFVVSLTQAAATAVTFNYYTTNGTAASPADFASTSGSATIGAGQTSLTIPVPVYGDTLNEGNETFGLVLWNVAGATPLRSSATGTIVDDDPLPTVSIADTSVVEGNSGTTTLTYTVSLSAPSGRYVYVNYATANGTATAGSDYTAASGSLTFSPGQTSRTVNVSVTGDTLYEPDETVYLSLSTPTYAALGRSQAVGTIVNDDPLPTVAVADASVTEGNSGTAALTFTLTLSQALTSAASVSYATADGTATAGSDYQAASGSVTFNAGVTTQAVTVLVNGDNVYEGNEAFSLNLSNPTGVNLGRSQAAGTILDDDPAPALSVNDVAVAEGDAGTSPATFTVSLPGPSAFPVSFYYYTTPGTAAPGRDYAEVNSTYATIAPGQTSTTVTVNVLGDTIAEPNETFGVYLFSPSGATIARSTGVGTILDDDPSGGTEIGSPAGGAVQDMTGSGTYGNVVTGTSYLSVQRYSQVYQNTPYDSRGILEFHVGSPPPAGGTVNLWFYENTFTSQDQPVLIYGYAGDGAVTAADATSPGVLLAGYDPKAGLGWHSVRLDAAQVASLSAGTGYLGLRFVGSPTTNTGVSLTYYVPALDFLPAAPVVPTVSVADVSVVEGSTTGYAGPYSTPATFTLTLSQAVSTPVAVTYATGGGTALPGVASYADYQPATGTVIFNPGETTKTVTALVWQDTVPEPNETFNLQLTGVTDATLARAAATCTILNDDPPQVVIPAASVQEGNGPNTGYVTVGLAAPTTQTVTAHYYTQAKTAQPGYDYTDVSGTVTFLPGQTTATVAVPILGDHVVNGNRTFTLNIDTATNATVGTPTQAGPVTGVVTIVDDDHFPVVITASKVSGNEGTPTAFDASASYDPDGNPMSFAWDFGDGGTATGSVASHAYSDNGTYNATLTVTTPYAISTSFITVTVQNVAPAVAIAGPAAAVPGQSQVYILSATDPSPVDQAGTFTFQVDWGDGQSAAYQVPVSSLAVAHTYATPGTYTITVTATDKDNGTGPAATQAVGVVPALVQNGDLYVGGTAGDDQITLQPADATSGQVAVTLNGQSLGTFAPTGKVVVFGLAGNDTIRLLALPTDGGSVPFALPAVLMGGTGNDTLDATGSVGPTVLYGDTGSDLLLGGSGNNLMIGGVGVDTLVGSAGEDLLIGGDTSWSWSPANLARLMAEWGRTDADYATRIAHLTGTAPGGANGTLTLTPGSTVFDDSAADNLTGNAGLDWFFQSAGDQLLDFDGTAERLTTV